MFNAKTIRNIGFDSNAYEGRWTEDGDRRTEWAYKIIAEMVDGSRYYLGLSCITSEEKSYAEIEKIQLARILKIERHLAAGGSLDKDRWYETEARYGSIAFDRLDREGHYKALEYKEFLFNGQ